ncbi:hypothetical protein H0H93_005096, partial [Arthromyces matolae]
VGQDCVQNYAGVLRILRLSFAADIKLPLDLIDVCETDDMLSQDRQTRLESKIVCAALSWVDEEYTSSSCVKKRETLTVTETSSPRLSHLEKETWALFADVTQSEEELTEAKEGQSDLSQPDLPSLVLAAQSHQAPSALVVTSHPLPSSLPSPPSSPSPICSVPAGDPAVVFNAEFNATSSLPSLLTPLVLPKFPADDQMSDHPRRDSCSHSFASALASEIPAFDRENSRTDKKSDLPCHFVSNAAPGSSISDAPIFLAPIANHSEASHFLPHLADHEVSEQSAKEKQALNR